jgi:hypothetical protein
MNWRLRFAWWVNYTRIGAWMREHTGWHIHYNWTLAGGRGLKIARLGRRRKSGWGSHD